MLFNAYNNVPEVYSEESRDFLTISQPIDIIYNSLISNLLKMNYIDDIELVDSKLLDLIKEYLGFFTEQYYPENLLRSILLSFPYMIKYKGSFKGIETAIKALQNAYTDISYIAIDKGDERNTFEIKTDGILINQNYIQDVLKYVLPVGTLISEIKIVQDINNLDPEKITSKDVLNGLQFTDDSEGDYLIGTIRNNNSYSENNFKNTYVSKIGQTLIVKSAIKTIITPSR